MDRQYAHKDGSNNVVTIVLDDGVNDEMQELVDEEGQIIGYTYAAEKENGIEWLEAEVIVNEDEAENLQQFGTESSELENYFTIEVISDGWLKSDTFLNRYECKRCDPHVSFPKLVELLCHSLTVHDTINYKCNLCGEKCHSSDIEAHLELHERASVSLTESNVELQNVREENALGDYLVDERPKALTKIVTYKDTLNEDIVVGSKVYHQIDWNGKNILLRKFTRNDEVWYKCKVCTELFSEPAHVVAHMDANHFGDDVPAMAKKPKISRFAKRIKQLTGKWPKSVRESQLMEAVKHLAEDRPTEVLLDVESLSCQNCGKLFGSPEKLAAHTVCYPNSEEFKCLFCSRSFVRKASLIRHLRNHTGERPFPCSQCEKAFISQLHLKKHVLHLHSTNDGENNIQFNEEAVKGDKANSCVCGFCNKVLSSRFCLQTHLRLHTKEQPFGCSMCPKRFYSNNTLKLHMLDHTGERPFDCSFCGKGFKQLVTLKVHERTHTGEKPYQCPTCNRCFVSHGALHLHKDTHSKNRVKRFKCNLCVREYSKASNLARHQDLHFGIKRFSCSICSKLFTQAKSLKDHLNLHTGEKPHKCSECEKSFSNSSTLTRHLASKHGSCNSQFQTLSALS